MKKQLLEELQKTNALLQQILEEIKKQNEVATKDSQPKPPGEK